MKRTSSIALAVAALWLACRPSDALGQEAAYTRPTPQHEMLKRDVGVWDAEVTLSPAPGAEPVKSQAVETNKMLGEFWLLSKFEGEMGGEKFTGRSATGYDPIEKKYVGGWVDSISPFMMDLEGQYDEASKTLTMYGEGVDCRTGQEYESKMVTVYKGDDSKTFTMYMKADDDDGAGGDPWQKTMEINYTRR